MLSFLQQRLGKSPSKSNKSMTRQDSIESAFARVNARNVTKDASVTPSLTTATSVTDTSSEPAENPEKPEATITSLRHPRASIESCEEKLQSDWHPDNRQTLGAGIEDHIGLNKTLLEGEENDSQEQLLQKSVRALDEDWNIGALPGDNLGLPAEDEGGIKKRKSTRLTILEQASTAMETTTSVLGKKGREAMEAGMEKIHALKGRQKRPTKRPAESEPASVESPKKRARFSAVPSRTAPSPRPSARASAAKKRSKHWVTQGLYVGQSPDFDPRLTETKNKKKIFTKDRNTKTSSIMPLPMFAGERTLTQGRDFKLPFDVFSPLPPGQPKPDEWKKTHKSMSLSTLGKAYAKIVLPDVFIGDAADLWKKAKPMEHSLCICNKEDGCDEHCFNRFMLYECDESNCNIGAEHCTNRAFADLKKRCKQGGKYNIGVEVMKTVDRGYGVRANRTFEPNQIIIEYTGEIITQEECDNRMNTRYKDAEASISQWSIQKSSY